MAESIRALLEEFSKKIISGVAFFDRDVEQRVHEQATLSSAHYVLDHMLMARPFRQRQHSGNGHLELLEHALSLVRTEGFYGEFGVHKGESLAFIAARIDKVVYGFDSFEGLPDAWSPAVGRGAFGLNGKPPTLSQILFRNFRLVHGLFRDTLPSFAAQVPEPAAFLHVDCYLYESTKDILDNLGDRIGPGTVIVFRQYFNFPGWQSQQFRAFQEFCARTGLTYAYVGYVATGSSVAVVVQ